jgi:hypothetical protein
MPAGWPTGEHNARVTIEDDISLPLLVPWRTGPAIAGRAGLRAEIGAKP